MKKIVFFILLIFLFINNSFAFGGLCLTKAGGQTGEGDCTTLVEEVTYNVYQSGTSGTVTGTGARCQCVCPPPSGSGFNQICACAPSVNACYDTDYYPKITCNPGYKISGLNCIPCTGCTNCTSDADFVSNGTGYEKKVTKKCDCETCSVQSTTYRCAAGYYGTTTNGTSGCTKCPDTNSNSVAGTNSAITNCFIPKDKSITDSTGTYTYTSDCYYTN